MTKGARRLPRLRVRIRSTLRGCGEVLSAVGAADIAIGELFLGRWPQPDRIKSPPEPEKIAPYPIDD